MGLKLWNWSSSQFYAKKSQKNGHFLCPVSVKLGPFFETRTSFSETDMKLCTVSAEFNKMGQYKVKTKIFGWNRCKNSANRSKKIEIFVQNEEKNKIFEICVPIWLKGIGVSRFCNHKSSFFARSQIMPIRSCFFHCTMPCGFTNF